MKKPVDFFEMKANGEKITMITAYDYPSAKNVENAGADMILVGDSLGMVVLGYDSTVPVTLGDMIHHTKAVKRGAPDTFIVADMPFMTYHGELDETIQNARELIQASGAHAVKLEGAGDVAKKIAALSKAGAPVVAHLGLTPQSIGLTGSYKVRAKSNEEAKQLIEDAKAVEEAGAIALVLEAIPKQLAEEVTKQLSIPTIGIGAGAKTDGQVLVYHDIIGYGITRRAKFVKAYADVDPIIVPALSEYVSEVKSATFPDDAHSFTMKEEELRGLYGGEN
ncbi:3-methyl-2-oxobutanoate hydroxymethyltransferase [Listeria floridensis FSL S10-1187]|uniref:3-methyl-2-oxobutanoate hydroxymethyltransferase n=1 Tax=Listeria floridensis FSL S10-1187 TaxID=1265817 RepID=A0ABN0RGD9_9LIST|nr:3-methyl-2-oxobutanoate hydroxymethyltransferase [Listeria floridensis]EUJ32957.1 3-methyl-2-oxobutanoate hydroxymethyltransferase [Listeria floridensis FSL S10-1187]